MKTGDLEPDELNEILQCLGQGIVYQEADGSIKFFNPTAQRILGISEDEATRSTYTPLEWHLIYEDGSPCPGEEYPSMITLRTGQALSGETRGIARPGQPVVWISINTRPVFRPGGQLPEAVVTSFHDITERKRAEDFLQESENRLLLCIQQAPAALAMFDRQMCYLAASRRWMKDYHLGDRDIIGLSHYDVFPEITDAWKAVHNRGLAGEVIEEDEEQFLRLDGTVQWLRWEVKPWHEIGGEVGGIIIFSEDITRRKRAEEALHASEERLHLALDSAHAGTWEWQLPTNHNVWSEELWGLYGLQPHSVEPSYESWRESVHPDDRTRVEEAVQNAAQSGGEINIEWRVNLPDPQVRWLMSRGRPFFDEYGKPSRYLGIVLDITARKEDEEEIKTRTATFEAAFASSPYVMLLVDAEGRVVEINHAGQTMVGHPKEELLGLLGGQVFGCINSFRQGGCGRAPECAQCPVRTRMEHTFATKQPTFNEEGSLEVMVGGRKVRLDLLISTSLVSGTGADMVLVNILDVSDRKRAEERLIESEKRYRSLFVNMNAGFVLFEVIQGDQGVPEDLVILGANEGFAATTGLKIPDVIGKRLTQVLPGIENDAADWIGTYGKVALTGESRQFEQGSELLGIYYSVSAYQPAPKQCAVTFVDITEHKQAEAALRESERFGSAVAKTTPAVVYVYDLETASNVYANDGIESLLGYAPAEVQAMGREVFARLIHPEDLGRVLAFQAQLAAATDGEVLDIEYRMRHADGRWLTLHSFEQVFLRNASGTPKQKIGVAIDVTARQQAEQEWQKFVMLADSSSEFIGMCDLDMNPLYVNPAGVRMVGLPDMAAACRAKVQDYFFPEDQRFIVEDFFPRVLREGHGDVEIRLRHFQTGEPIWMFYYLFHVLDASGQTVGWATVSRNITERKRADERLQASRDYLDRIINAIGDPVFVKDEEFRFTLVNDALCTLLGKAREEIIGTTGHEYLPPDQMDHFLEVDRKVFSTGVEDTRRELLTAGDGKLRTIVTKKTLYADGRGAKFIVGVIRDITEHERLEDQFRLAQKMESVGRLAGGVAHDFNNMLAVILGYTEMALEKFDPSTPLHENLQETYKAAVRATDITRQLLAFARRQTVAPKVLDLNDTVEGMLKMLRRLIGEDIDLVWLPGKNLPQVKIDPSQIDQILANLCVNARDAIADTGKITIETGIANFDENYCEAHAGFVTGEFVMLAVSDDGCGMNRETLPQVFEPFFTTKELGKGTGLGLATVYGIIKQNNGFINVYSEPGQGTTFKIYLPRHVGKREGLRAQFTAEPVARGHETILLVEDEPTLLSMTTSMLERLGYTVVATGSPGEAIRLAKEYAGWIDLLLTDVVMPDMNGRDLAKNMLSIRPGMRCIFMSGYTANVIVHHGVLDEGVHFIQKPFSLKDLGGKIREALLDSPSDQ